MKGKKWEQKKGYVKGEKAVICFPFSKELIVIVYKCALNTFYCTQALLNASYRHEIFKTFPSDKRLLLW